MTLDGVLAVLQKKLAAAGLVKDSIVEEISFEYMSVEAPKTYNSTVFPCWRFCIATTQRWSNTANMKMILSSMP